MAIKLKNIDKWRTILEGEVVTLAGGGQQLDARLIKLECNAPFPTRLYVGTGDDQRFLALINGFEVVEFYEIGEVDIHADGAYNLYTAEFERLSVEIPDAESFTTIVERRHRNPELEFIAGKMQQNMERRLAIATRDTNMLLDRLTALEAERNVVDTRAPSGGIPEGKRAQDERPASGGEDGGEAEPVSAPAPAAEAAGGANGKAGEGKPAAAAK